MAGLLPVVRHMIVCEDIPVDPANPRRVTLVNLLTTIRSPSQPPFPLRYPKLCVYVQLAVWRGTGEARLQIEQADTQTAIFQTPLQRVSFGNDPLQVFNLSFRVRNCTFPSAGLYWVQLWYNNLVLHRESLKLE
jgi:hypothetical protein